MKIGVMGAGAVGAYIGGSLAASGHTVTLVGRPALGEELRHHPLTLSDLDGRRIQVDAARFVYSTQPAALRDCEVVLVTVKGRDTEATGRLLAANLAPGAIVVSFQNGLDNGAILRRAMPGATVLEGMVPFNVLWSPNASFHRGTSGPLVVLRHPPVSQRLAQALRESGLEASEHADLAGVLAGKLLINLNNAVNALVGVPLREELSDRSCRRILAASMREGLAVFRATGYRPRRVGKMIPQLAPYALSAPNALFFRVAGAMVKIDPLARSSMWEDLERRRPTEIHQLNGAIVRLGRQAGIPTPVNAALTALVEDAEQKGQGSPTLGASGLAQALAQRR